MSWVSGVIMDLPQNGVLIKIIGHVLGLVSSSLPHPQRLYELV